jgi:hypothetical protein
MEIRAIYQQRKQKPYLQHFVNCSKRLCCRVEEQEFYIEYHNVEHWCLRRMSKSINEQ